MDGAELRAIREKLGLSSWRMGLAFGYSGDRDNLTTQVYRYEADKRAIPPWIARLALMFDQHGVPDGWADPVPTPTNQEEANGN